MLKPAESLTCFFDMVAADGAYVFRLSVIESESFSRSNDPASRAYVPGFPFWGFPGIMRTDGAPTRGRAETVASEYSSQGRFVWVFIEA